MFSFQVLPKSHLIKTLIFRYREEIPIFYPLLNILQTNFRKLSQQSHIPLFTCILFFATLETSPIPYSGQSFRLPNKRSWDQIPLAVVRFLLLSEFFKKVSGFFEGSSWILQLIFVIFSGRLLISSRDITGKNQAHQLPKNSQELFWIFLTVCYT